MKTCLEEFFSNKISTHVEPSRRGTPRGNPIGFTKVKYQAVLVSTLTNINLIKLAGKLEGSYNVLRKWNTKVDFKACCNSISDEFKAIIDFELLDIFTHLAEDFKHGKFHEHDELFARFKDADTYNKTIISHITDRLNHYLYELPNGQVAFFDMAHYLAKYSGSQKLLELLIQLQKRLKENLIEEIIETLQKPELSEQERGGVVIKLKRLTA